MGTIRGAWILGAVAALIVGVAAAPASGQATEPTGAPEPQGETSGLLLAQLLPRRPGQQEEKPAEGAPGAPPGPSLLPRRPTAPEAPAAPPPEARPVSPKTEPAGGLEPEPDRWRLLLPGATLQPRTPLYDPYNPNVLKGDYPILGDKTFFAVTATLDTLFDQKRNLDFTRRNPNAPFHEDTSIGQVTASVALELFHGTTVFAPKDWAIRVTPLYRFRCNDDNAQEHQCGTQFTLFEAFGELELFEIGDTFDPTSARLGIQVFNADFFGFVYNDTQPGFRLFSEIARNQFKVNLAFFDRLNKDFLTALNEIYDRRDHQVGVLSFQWDDFLWPGFNILPNAVISHDNVLPGGALEPRAVQVQFRYAFVVDREGLTVVDVTNPGAPRATGARVAIADARDIYVMRSYAYIAAGAQGLAIVDVERPEAPGVPAFFTAGGAISDATGVTIGATYVGQYAYVADGRNGLRVVKLIDSATPGYLGWSPAPMPELIASVRTAGPALSVAEGYKRDRAVDEGGNQIGISNRLGAHPFTSQDLARIVNPRNELITVENSTPRVRR